MSDDTLKKLKQLMLNKKYNLTYTDKRLRELEIPTRAKVILELSGKMSNQDATEYLGRLFDAGILTKNTVKEMEKIKSEEK